MLIFQQLLFLYDEEQIFVFHHIFKLLNMSNCVLREILEKGLGSMQMFWDLILFQARALNSKSPETAILRRAWVSRT